MSYQLIKYQNTEGGPFTPSNNRCSININQNEGSINMSKSHILLECDLSFSNTTTYTGELKLGDKGNGNTRHTASSLIRTASLETEKKGLLEENKHVNVLSQTLANYNKSNEDWNGGNYFGDGACWVKDNKTFLKVPMEEIYGMGDMNNYPCEQLGHTTLKLEFENQQSPQDLFYQSDDMKRHDVESSCEDVAGSATDVIFTTETFKSADIMNELLKVDDPVTVFYTEGGVDKEFDTTIKSLNLNAQSKAAVELNKDLPVSTQISFAYKGNSVNFDDYTATANVDINQVGVTMNSIDYENNIVVGMKYRVAVEVANQFNVEDATITSVEVVPKAGNTPEKIRVKWSEKLSIATGAQAIQISMTRVKAGDVDTFSISRATAVIARNNGTVGKAPTSYMTHRLEMTNNDATSDYRHQFKLENNTLSSYILPVRTGLMGQKNGITSYRLTLNGEDTTNRDVEYASSLYDDVLLRNIPELKSLNHDNGSTNVFTAPLVYTDEGDKVLNFHAKGGTIQAGIVYCFKKIVNPL